jgi:hypothetical protein
MKVIALLIALVLPCFAEYTTTVETSYETADGWSGKYKREVTFMKAVELRKKGVGVNAADRTPFAVIWFSQDNVAIVELFKDVTPLGDIFDNKDFHKLLRVRSAVDGVSVNDGDANPRRWKFWKRR